ncbi:hypothetical protein pEaSNUABM11_00298 [Erwinia phage pEa_SNUABM_11]|nr:hypothetical protein pEaSNUABM11_00298 [Erwinia phage pEa_SNUABM_11]
MGWETSMKKKINSPVLTDDKGRRYVERHGAVAYLDERHVPLRPVRKPEEK